MYYQGTRQMEESSKRIPAWMFYLNNAKVLNSVLRKCERRKVLYDHLNIFIREDERNGDIANESFGLDRLFRS